MPSAKPLWFSVQQLFLLDLPRPIHPDFAKGYIGAGSRFPDYARRYIGASREALNRDFYREGYAVSRLDVLM